MMSLRSGLSMMLGVALWVAPSISQAALIERIMGEPGAEKIRVHVFYALNHQRIEGALTRQNVIDALGLTGADITEYDALAALAPTGTAALNVAQKAMFLESIHSIFILAEERVTGYSTPAQVRAKLGLP